MAQTQAQTINLIQWEQSVKLSQSEEALISEFEKKPTPPSQTNPPSQPPDLRIVEVVQQDHSLLQIQEINS